MAKAVILVTGPESSGTRWIAGLMSQHPAIDRGTTGGHEDPLDDFWGGKAQEIPEGLTLTRRSLPAGRNGEKARFMDFDNLKRLFDACDDLMVVATVRSPFANIVSWARNRESVQYSPEKAIEQYHAAYAHIHPYVDYYLPFEAVILDGSECLSGLFRLMGFPAHQFEVDARSDVNRKHYGLG